MKIQCSRCGGDMEIDSPQGEAYIEEQPTVEGQRGEIHHVECPPQATQTQEQPAP